MEEIEIWKTIDGYENYQVGDLGNVKSLNYNNTGREGVLKPAKNHKGYFRVGIMLDNKLGTRSIHRLVALAFIPNPENKPQVNHINCIKTDNRVENLEWCTSKENTIHAIENNKFHFNAGWNKGNINNHKYSGENIGTSILTEKQVEEIRIKFKPYKYTRKMLAKEYKVSELTIKDVVLRKSWKHLK